MSNQKPHLYAPEKRKEPRNHFLKHQDGNESRSPTSPGSSDCHENGREVQTFNNEKEMKKPGLYANINAKRERIAAGSGEKMRKPGEKGAPTAKAFRESAKTAKKK